MSSESEAYRSLSYGSFNSTNSFFILTLDNLIKDSWHETRSIKEIFALMKILSEKKLKKMSEREGEKIFLCSLSQIKINYSSDKYYLVVKSMVRQSTEWLIAYYTTESLNQIFSLGLRAYINHMREKISFRTPRFLGDSQSFVKG